jgi:hypothetical protein
MAITDLIARLSRYNQVIREVAKSYDTLLVGDEHSIPADERHYTASVHVTDAGGADFRLSIPVADGSHPTVRTRSPGEL